LAKGSPSDKTRLHAQQLVARCAAETRGLAELIEDHFTAETLLEIALRYDELALRAEQRPSGED
jgi:hypothetical protein